MQSDNETQCTMFQLTSNVTAFYAPTKSKINFSLSSKDKEHEEHINYWLLVQAK